MKSLIDLLRNGTVKAKWVGFLNIAIAVCTVSIASAQEVDLEDKIQPPVHLGLKTDPSVLNVGQAGKFSLTGLEPLPWPYGYRLKWSIGGRVVQVNFLGADAPDGGGQGLWCRRPIVAFTTTENTNELNLPRVHRVFSDQELSVEVDAIICDLTNIGSVSKILRPIGMCRISVDTTLLFKSTVTRQNCLRRCAVASASAPNAACLWTSEVLR